jgi:hypothetical protein
MPLSTGPRSAFEQAVLDRQKQLANASGNKNRIIQPQEIEALAAEFFGALKAPEGVKIISQSPLELIYETADGKQYRQFRNLSGSLGADVGRVETKLLGSPISAQSALKEQELGASLSDQVRRLSELYTQQSEALARGEIPEGLDSGTSNYLSRLDDVINRLSNTGLANLDPQTQAALASIQNATQARLAQQFQDESSSLVAQLFGQGVNRSSIAGEQAGRLLGQQGLVQSQVLSDAAQRELSVRQFLTQLEQQNAALAGQTLLEGAGLNLQDFTARQALADERAGRSQQLLSDILNQLLQREIAGSQLEQSGRRIDLEELFGREQSLLARDAFELQARQQRRANNPLSKILSGVLGAGLSFATGGLSIPGLGGLGRVTRTPPFNPSSGTASGSI